MLGDASNGEMGEIPGAAGVVRTIMQEAERCNAALGIQLDPERPVDKRVAAGTRPGPHVMYAQQRPDARFLLLCLCLRSPARSARAECAEYSPIRALWLALLRLSGGLD